MSTIQEKVENEIKKFAKQHESEFLAFPKYKDKGDAFDYMPDYLTRQKMKREEFPESQPLMKELSDKIFQLIFGDDMSKLTFDLKGHMKEIEGKSIKETSQKDFLWNRYSEKKLRDTIAHKVVFAVYFTLLNDKDLFLISDLMDNTFMNPIAAYHCPDCDESIYMDFNCITKKFTLADHLKPCTKFKNIHQFKLKVPGRRIVLLNDSRKLLEVSRKDQYKISINSVLGKINECKAYQKHNVGYFCFSDCGGVNVLHSKDRKIIVLDVHNTKYSYFDEGKNEYVNMDTFKSVGDIDFAPQCAFLWDAGEFDKLVSEKGIDLDNFEDLVYVDIDNDYVKIIYNIESQLVEIKY